MCAHIVVRPAVRHAFTQEFVSIIVQLKIDMVGSLEVLDVVELDEDEEDGEPCRAYAKP